MTDQQIKEQYEMFSDIWRLYKAYVNDIPDKWEDVLQKVDELTKKYHIELCYSLAHAVIEEFERVDNNEKI
ncbi:hypothetical protein AALB81_19100 [Lachnospiraceae bacterium 48-33]